MVIGELSVILSAAIGGLTSSLKTAGTAISNYTKNVSAAAKTASSQMNEGFKQIGAGLNTAKDTIIGALGIITKTFIALGGTIALIAWQGAKYAEDLWMAWTDAAGKIAAISPELDKFGSAIMNMAGKSKYTMTEAASAAKAAADEMLNEAQTLAVISAAMDYSTARGDNLTASVTGIAKAIRIFAKDNLTASDAADVLTKANIDAKVKASELEYPLRSLSGISKRLGWDFKDLIALLELFQKHNLEGGRVMMTLGNIINDVIDPTSKLGKQIAGNSKDSDKYKEIQAELALEIANTGVEAITSKEKIKILKEELAKTKKDSTEFKEITAVLALEMAKAGVNAITSKEKIAALGKELKLTGVNIRDSSGKVKDVVTLFRDLKTAGIDTSEIFARMSVLVGPAFREAVEDSGDELKNFRKSLDDTKNMARDTAAVFEMTLPGALGYFTARMKEIPTRLSFFLKDSLTAFFTPMQKAIAQLGEEVTKSGVAKKIDAALTPIFATLGGYISKILINWADFISKLKPEDIEERIKKIQGFFKDLWEILKKAFEGIDFAALIKGLFEALVMITVLIGKFMKWFSELPTWTKNLVIFTAAFLALGGASIVAGLLSLASALLQVSAALAGIKAAGGLILLTKLAGIAGVIAMGAVAISKLVGGYKESKATEKSEEYKSYQARGGKLGPGIYKEAIAAGQTEAFGIPLKETPEMLGLQKIKQEIEKVTKLNQDFTAKTDKQIGEAGESMEVLNKESAEALSSILKAKGSIIEVIRKNGNSVINLSEATLDLMIRLQNEISILNATYDSMKRRIAAISIAQQNRKGGL